MPLRKFDELIKDLKNKVYHPVYFLQGEEPFYIDSVADYIEKHVLGEMEKEFNQTILYGKDADHMAVASAARRYPMMSNYQVVMVREAQEMKWFNLKERDEKDVLLNYFTNPTPSTLLVFCFKYKKLDKRTSFAKLIEKHAQFFESKKMYDNELPAWIEKYIHSKGYKAENRVSTMIADYLGNDLSKISNELDKMFINLKEKTEITTKHIEDFIGISKEYNVFELQTALGDKNVLKANRIINYFAANPKNNPMVLVMANLFSYFNKLLLYQTLSDKSENNAAAVMGVGPYFVKDYQRAAKNYSLAKLESIVSYLREYDLKSKGVGSTDKVPDGDLLKELVFKILH